MSTCYLGLPLLGRDSDQDVSSFEAFPEPDERKFGGGSWVHTDGHACDVREGVFDLLVEQPFVATQSLSKSFRDEMRPQISLQLLLPLSLHRWVFDVFWSVGWCQDQRTLLKLSTPRDLLIKEDGLKSTIGVQFYTVKSFSTH